MARMPGATWRGPVPYNSGDGDQTPMEAADAMAEYRGVVLHIAAGYYEGTIAWQRNDASNISSHFVVSKAGDIAQMVDTHDRAWTQAAGNSGWLSIENAAFLPEALTAAQVEANAKILAWAHATHGIPLQLATSPSGRGLGHHSMGAENGVNWGHSACPGPAIKAQKPAILARAIAISIGGTTMAWEPTPHEVINAILNGSTDKGYVTGKEVRPNEAGSVTIAAGVNLRVAIDKLDKLAAAAAADEARDKAVLAAVGALATAGGVDAAPIVAAIEAVKVEVLAQLAAVPDAVADEQAARLQD